MGFLNFRQAGLIGEVKDVSNRFVHHYVDAIAEIAPGKHYCRVCPHRGTLLQLSDIGIRDGQQFLICPLHGLKFDPGDGTLKTP